MSRLLSILLLVGLLAAAPGASAQSSPTLSLLASDVDRFPLVTLTIQVEGASEEQLALLLDGALAVREEGIQRPVEAISQGESRDQLWLRYLSGFDCDGRPHPVAVSATLDGELVQAEGSIGPLPVNPGCNPSTPVPPTPTPTPSPSPPPEEEGSLLWAWLLGALVLIALVVIVVRLQAGREEGAGRYCRACSSWLEPGQKSCPFCGSKRTFRGP